MGATNGGRPRQEAGTDDVIGAAGALVPVSGHRLGVLVTLRASGQPQTSNVVYALLEQQVLISLTEDRAKTRNLRRDPRATLHVSTADMFS